MNGISLRKGAGIAAVGLTLILAASVPAGSVPAPVDLAGHYILENGLDLRVWPQPGSGQVAVLALVKTGYAAESTANSGYSHLLEHIVFSGTDDRSREQISREIKAMGGYLNGFTRDEYTGYILVVHRDDLDRGLDVLADMLFDSRIEEQAVMEARDVVLEEINRAGTRPDTAENDWWSRLLYGDSAFSRSGLGNPMTVRSVTREEVARHYGAQYVPDNMTILVTGDADPDTAHDAVRRAFGRRPPSGIALTGPIPGAITGHRVYTLPSPMPGIRVRIGFTGPEPASRDTEALELLAAALGGDDGLLARALQSAGIRPRSVGAGLSLNSGFSRFLVTMSLPDTVDPGGVLEVVTGTLDALPETGLPPDLLDSTREALVASEIMGRESLHYYLFGKAPWVIAGPPGQGLSISRWDHLAVEDLSEATSRYLAGAPYVSLVTRPGAPGTGERTTLSAPARVKARLDNGLVVVAEQRPGSEVFAMHLMTRNRSAVEPRDRKGIADFLHRLLMEGTESLFKDEIESEIRELGVSLATAGDPTTPFGDFYTSRLYSHIRLTCVRDRADRAMALVGDMVRSPAMRRSSVSNVRDDLERIHAYLAQRPGTVAGGLLADALYGGVLPDSVYGSPESLQNITVKDLRDFHARYFTGRNLIVTVVSGLAPEEAITLVEREFGLLPAGEEPPELLVPLTRSPAQVVRDLGKTQGFLAVGSVTAELAEGDRDILPVVSGLLNQILYEKLREKEGLAYSLGASLGPLGSRVVFTLTMGTSADKMEEARRRVREEIAAARTMEVREEDLARVVSDRLGTIQRRMMSSINRAYYLGVAAHSGLPHAFGDLYRTSLLSATPEDVRRAAARYLPQDDLVEAVVR